MCSNEFCIVHLELLLNVETVPIIRLNSSSNYFFSGELCPYHENILCGLALNGPDKLLIEPMGMDLDQQVFTSCAIFFWLNLNMTQIATLSFQEARLRFVPPSYDLLIPFALQGSIQVAAYHHQFVMIISCLVVHFSHLALQDIDFLSHTHNDCKYIFHLNTESKTWCYV